MDFWVRLSNIRYLMSEEFEQFLLRQKTNLPDEDVETDLYVRRLEELISEIEQSCRGGDSQYAELNRQNLQVLRILEQIQAFIDRFAEEEELCEEEDADETDTIQTEEEMGKDKLKKEKKALKKEVEALKEKVEALQNENRLEKDNRFELLAVLSKERQGRQEDKQKHEQEMDGQKREYEQKILNLRQQWERQFADLEGRYSREIKDLQKQLADLAGKKKDEVPAAGEGQKAAAQETISTEDKSSHIERLFWLEKNKDAYPVKAENLKKFCDKLCDMGTVDRYLASAPDKAAAYVKLLDRYKNKLSKLTAGIDWEDEIGDILRDVLSLLHKELFKAVFRPLYRGIRDSGRAFEIGLLKVLNEYLEGVGFYTRNTTRVGQVAASQDLNDMEVPFRDKWQEGKQHGEIVDVELLPYYLNYINEEGEKASVCTEGSMIVIE